MEKFCCDRNLKQSLTPEDYKDFYEDLYIFTNTPQEIESE